MRPLFPFFFAVAFVAVGVFFVFSSSAPGVIVSENETQHLMGSNCIKSTGTYSWVCYGGTCFSGGCGCLKKTNTEAGIYTDKLIVTKTCKDSTSCTVSYQEPGTTNCGE